MGSDAPAEIGHNSEAAPGMLKSIVERVERLEQEKSDLAADLKEVYSEAKGNGFNAAIIRKLVSIRKKDRAKVLEDKELLELYASALGCLDLV